MKEINEQEREVMKNLFNKIDVDWVEDHPIEAHGYLHKLYYNYIKYFTEYCNLKDTDHNLNGMMLALNIENRKLKKENENLKKKLK